MPIDEEEQRWLSHEQLASIEERERAKAEARDLFRKVTQSPRDMEPAMEPPPQLTHAFVPKNFASGQEIVRFAVPNQALLGMH